MPNPILGLDPIFPLLQVAGLGGAAVVLAIWLYRRGLRLEIRQRSIGLAALRGLAVGTVVVLLLNPVRTQSRSETGKPPLLVLLDNSHSMAVKDIDGKARFEVARNALLAAGGGLRSLSQQFSPVLFNLSERAVRVGEEAFSRTSRPDGARTRLAEGLTEALDAVTGATSGGVLLVSDGRNNGEASPIEVARQAKRRGFPVFTVCVGSTGRQKDVSLHVRRMQLFGAPDQEIPLAAEVRSVGFNGQRTEAQLLRDGKPVSTRSMILSDARPVTVSFLIREAKPGSYRYAVAVRPLPNESTPSNNRGSVFVQVLDARTRVLVLEGRPTWDAKFLIQALHTDPSIDVDAVFKLSEEKYFAVRGTEPAQESGSSPRPAPPAGNEPRGRTGAPQMAAGVTVRIPSTAAELARYDVVVIGKGFEEFFTPSRAAALKQYVSEHAGNLIFLRGKPEERASTLQALEPVTWSDDQIRDFRMQITEQGLAHPAFSFQRGGNAQDVVKRLPTMISATRLLGEKALSVVLARTAGTPGVPGESKEMAVLAYQPYGQGKTVSLVGQGLWRWAFLPPELKEFAGCYNDFWTQLVRWLVSQADFLPGREVTMKTDRTSYGPGEQVRLMVFSRGPKVTHMPPIKIITPDGQTLQTNLTPGGGSGQPDFVGTFRPTAAGEHLATLPLSKSAAGTILTPFSVFPSREEDLITAADASLMAQIAAVGGGESLSLPGLRALPQKLRDARAMLKTRTDSQPVWDQWWVLAVILGLLSLEWIFRRRWGLA